MRYKLKFQVSLYVQWVTLGLHPLKIVVLFTIGSLKQVTIAQKFRRILRMKTLQKAFIAWILFLGLSACAQTPKMTLPFNITPEMYASFMAQSLVGSLPHTFKHKDMSLVVTKVYAEQNKVFFKSTTTQYKQILAELNTYHTLPDDLKKQCKDFSAIAMVDKGVEYYLHVEENEKKFVVKYDKEACSQSFDPAQKIFIGGYNRYGFDINGVKKGVKKPYM